MLKLMHGACIAHQYEMLKSRHTEDDEVEVGIDEAGRGCLWGPLIAAAVEWPIESTWSEELRAISGQIKDSKKVSPKKRAVLELAIKQHAVSWSLGRVEADEIDKLGMTKANRLAFVRALEGLGKTPGRIIVDGILPTNYGPIEVVEPEADGKYLAVAAASILAKEGRDTIVKEICEAESGLGVYGLVNSKGYGTLAHRSAIKEHGMHSQHRRLFLRKLLGLDHTVTEEYAFQD